MHRKEAALERFDGQVDAVDFFPQMRPANQAAHGPRRAPVRRAHVLVAEPVGTPRADLVELLCEDGHDVELVDEPAALFQQLRAGGRRPFDVLLWGFDLRHPASVTWQEELRRSAAKLPIVLLSGGGWLATANAAMRLGAVGILRRPLEANMLRGVVAASIRPGRS